jgi:hypothetical protein
MTIGKRVRRVLAGTLLAATTIGGGLALAPGASPAAGATPPDQCTTRTIDIVVGGRRGSMICEYGRTDVTYEGRHHVFIVGANEQVYHIWQTAKNGAYSAWTSLGGRARSEVFTWVYPDGSLELSVLGTDGNFWCDIWDGATARGRWTGWHRCAI